MSDLEPIWTGILVAGRILPAAFWVPALGGKRLPVPAKLALVSAITLAVTPGIDRSELVQDLWVYLGLLMKELGVGLVVALVAATLFEALHLSGRLVDRLAGSTGAHAMLPHSDERTSPLGDLYLLCAILIFFATGGPVLFLGALQGSFDRLPLAVMPSGNLAARAAGLVIALTAEALNIAVSLAFPAMISLLLADFILGLMNRTAPQVQVFFLGMPLRFFIGVGAALLTLDGALERFELAMAGWF